MADKPEIEKFVEALAAAPVPETYCVVPPDSLDSPFGRHILGAFSGLALPLEQRVSGAQSVMDGIRAFGPAVSPAQVSGNGDGGAAVRAIVAAMRADLQAVGGFDNGLIGVPAFGVREYILKLEAALAAAPVVAAPAQSVEQQFRDALAAMLNDASVQSMSSGQCMAAAVAARDAG